MEECSGNSASVRCGMKVLSVFIHPASLLYPWFSCPFLVPACPGQGLSVFSRSCRRTLRFGSGCCSDFAFSVTDRALDFLFAPAYRTLLFRLSGKPWRGYVTFLASNTINYPFTLTHLAQHNATFMKHLESFPDGFDRTANYSSSRCNRHPHHICRDRQD